jgi:hypothetical protein
MRTVTIIDSDHAIMFDDHHAAVLLVRLIAIVCNLIVLAVFVLAYPAVTTMRAFLGV